MRNVRARTTAPRQRTLQRRRTKRKTQVRRKQLRTQARRAQVKEAAKQISERIFLNVLESDSVRTEIEPHLPSDYRNRVYSPTVTLAMFLRQALNGSSLRKAITEAMAAGLVPTTVSKRTTSYSNARSRLPVKLVQRLTRVIAHELQRCTPEQWKWRGRQVKLVDGSEIECCDTPVNQAAYPQPTTQKDGVGFPHARIVAMISLATAAVLGIAIGPREGKGTGEHALLRQLLSSLSRGDVLVGDSYYASYWLIATLERMGVDFVFEQHGARDTDFREGKKLGERDHLMIWERPKKPEWMTDRDYARIPEELTVRECKVNKKVLVTSLINPRDVPKREVGELFSLRWNVELDLRNIKTTLGMEFLYCLTPEMCQKELAVYMLGYNLIRLVMAQAALQADVLPRQLSFQNAVDEWLACSQAGKLDTAEGVADMLRGIAAVRVGNRPGRVEPRSLKHRRKPFPLQTTSRLAARRRILRNGHAKKLIA
jgi:hypothetical protein